MTTLSGFDESVSIQAASILTENNIDITGPEVVKSLSHASTKVRNGFNKFIKP